jgi:hypothetical protein
MSTHMTQPTTTSVLRAAWGNPRLWLLQIVSATIVSTLTYAWLWIPDEKAWQVIGTALLGVTVFFLWLWLIGGTLAFFRGVHSGGEQHLWPSFRSVVRRLPALAAWFVILLFLLWLIGLTDNHIDSWGGLLASAMTMTFRRPVHPARMVSILETAQWVLAWGLIPLFLWPLAEIAASEGWHAFRGAGLRAAFRRAWSRRYWLSFAAIFLIGVCVPCWLVWWVPGISRMSLETTSLAIRFVIAYFLMIAGWLALASLLGKRGSEKTG